MPKINTNRKKKEMALQIRSITNLNFCHQQYANKCLSLSNNIQFGQFQILFVTTKNETLPLSFCSVFPKTLRNDKGIKSVAQPLVRQQLVVNFLLVVIHFSNPHTWTSFHHVYAVNWASSPCLHQEEIITLDVYVIYLS